MLDVIKLREKLKIVQRERSLLEDFVGIAFEDFVADDKIHEYYGALHHLQIALQAALDVCQHIVAQKLLGPYKENKEVFGILSRKSILSAEVGKTFEAAVGVRNILVHQYEDVDPKKVYNAIQNNLPDFDKFVDEIGEYLKKEGGDEHV